MMKMTAYLEGATPTRFGPKPLKRERGPSFSSINLSTKYTQKNEHYDSTKTIGGYTFFAPISVSQTYS